MRRRAARLSRGDKQIRAARRKAREKRGSITMKSKRFHARPLSLLLVALSLLLVVPGLLKVLEVAHASGSGTWTPTGSNHYYRNNYTATLLPNGKVLVAGGVENTILSF